MVHRNENMQEPPKPAENVRADELRSRLIRELPDFLNERHNERGQTISLREHGVDVRADDGTDHEPSDELVFVQVNHVERVKIFDLRLDDVQDERSAVVTLRLFGSITGLVVPGRSDTNEEVDTAPIIRSYSNDVVDVDAEVRWDSQWNLASVDAIDMATITVLPCDQWREKHERWVAGRA